MGCIVEGCPVIDRPPIRFYPCTSTGKGDEAAFFTKREQAALQKILAKVKAQADETDQPVEILQNTFFRSNAALHSYGPGPHSC